MRTRSLDSVRIWLSMCVLPVHELIACGASRRPSGGSTWWHAFARCLLCALASEEKRARARDQWRKKKAASERVRAQKESEGACQERVCETHTQRRMMKVRCAHLLGAECCSCECCSCACLVVVGLSSGRDAVECIRPLMEVDLSAC